MNKFRLKKGQSLFSYIRDSIDVPAAIDYWVSWVFSHQHYGKITVVFCLHFSNARTLLVGQPEEKQKLAGKQTVKRNITYHSANGKRIVMRLLHVKKKGNQQIKLK